MESVDDIDSIMASAKSVAGIARWTVSRQTTVRLKAALIIDEEVRSGLFIASDATVHTSPQQGSIVLIYRNVAIERMSVFPPAPHSKSDAPRATFIRAWQDYPGARASLLSLDVKPSLAAPTER